MGQHKNRIAIVSPSKHAYSETFIKNQKDAIKGEVYYYYGGQLPRYLDEKGKVVTKFVRKKYNVLKTLNNSPFSLEEYGFIHSMRKYKIDLVFAHYGTTSHKILNVCKFLKIPLITHFHGFDASVKEHIEGSNNYKEVFEYSSYVIAVSKFMQSKLAILGCKTEKVIYNSCTPSDDFFEIKPTFKNNTFIALGRFIDKKAPYYTILAFQKVLKEFPDAKLIVGGEGSLFEVCVNLIKHLNIGGNVKLPGKLTKEEYMEYLRTSMAFVQHSITAINGDQEGTPVAVLEANAAGLPVISTRHTGIAEVIVHNETGLLVEEHDVNEMALGMLSLLKDKKRAIEMGQKGKERIQKHYNSNKQIEVLDELIENAIVKYDYEEV